MEMAAVSHWSLHPDTVIREDARRWHGAMTSSVLLHAVAIALVTLFGWKQAAQLQLPVLTVFMPQATQPPVHVTDHAVRPLSSRVPDQSPAPQAHTDARTDIIRTTDPAADSVPQAAPGPSTKAVTAGTAAGPATTAAIEAARAPASSPDPSALANYGSVLAAAVDRFKHYPRIALLRQWQGTVVLQLSIGSDGRVQDYRLARSSGHDALDQQALDMLRQSLPLPLAPARLAGMDLAVDIPVVFRIAD
jgi:protein TonB